MDEVLKNRLVGVLVIGLTLVIFLPLWLDGENAAALSGEQSHTSIPELNIPPVPHLEPIIVPDLLNELAEVNRDIDNAHRVDLEQVETQLNEVFAIDVEENSDDNIVSNNDATNVTNKEKSAQLIEQAKQENSSSTKPDSRKQVWAIQVASFNEADSTNALKTKLRKKNFSVYSREFTKKNGKKGYRVYVGPILQTKEAERVQKQLHEALSISDTFILRYKT